MDLLGIGFKLIDYVGKWYQLKMDKKAKLKLLYIEVKLNLNILDKISYDESFEQDAPEYKEIINLLETNFLQMLFMDGIIKNDKNFIKTKKFIVKDIENFENEVEKEVVVLFDLVKSCEFVYVKIAELKKLASIDDNNLLIGNVFYKRRLQNIKGNLHEIRLVIKENL